MIHSKSFFELTDTFEILMKKILSSSLLLSSIAVGALAQSQKPNVILILCDDLGYSDIEPYGQEKIKTPNLTQMANAGIQFNQFYSGTSVSAPSRASLMTGLHTGHAHVRGNKEYSPEGQEPIGKALTLGNLFQQAGYATACFGKWGLGFPGSGSEATDKGFDTFFGYNCQRQAHTYYPQWLYRDKVKLMLEGKAYSQDLIHEHALKFIEENSNNPFFIYLTYTLPHAGLEQPNDSLVAMYRGVLSDTKPFAGVGNYAATPEPHAQFAAMVSRLDAYVGQIRKELTRLGIAENTLLIFTSDNGPHTEGGADPKFFANEQTLRGQKRSLYEGGIRVPMIAEWKGTIQPGTKSFLPAAFWDMMPTFGQISGIDKKWIQPTDGVSILPELIGKGKQKTHKSLYWEFHEEGGRQAIRKGDWKLIKLKVNSDAPVYELYNLRTDPMETNNLAATKHALVSKLRKEMDKSRTTSGMFNFGIK